MKSAEPLSTCFSRPVVPSQSITRVSSPAVAMTLPSARAATPRNGCSWPWSEKRRSPVFTCHTCATLSRPTLTRCSLSPLKTRPAAAEPPELFSTCVSRPLAGSETLSFPSEVATATAPPFGATLSAGDPFCVVRANLGPFRRCACTLGVRVGVCAARLNAAGRLRDRSGGLRLGPRFVGAAAAGSHQGRDRETKGGHDMPLHRLRRLDVHVALLAFRSPDAVDLPRLVTNSNRFARPLPMIKGAGNRELRHASIAFAFPRPAQHASCCRDRRWWGNRTAGQPGRVMLGRPTDARGQAPPARVRDRPSVALLSAAVITAQPEPYDAQHASTSIDRVPLRDRSRIPAAMPSAVPCSAAASRPDTLRAARTPARALDAVSWPPRPP